MKRSAETAPPDARRGISYVEVAISLVLVSTVLLASLRTLEQSLRSQDANLERQTADLLVEDLLSEVMRQAYRERSETPAFGPETSENTGHRAGFDDVDDYHNWSRSPPEGKSGVPLSGYDGWRREVQVQWVDPGDWNSPVGSDQGLKKITVTALRNGRIVAAASAIRAEQSPNPWESR